MNLTKSKNYIKQGVTVLAVAFGVSLMATTANADTQVTVKSGDTVWELAQTYNTSISSIQNANSINPSTNLIYIGQTLSIPTGTVTTQANPVKINNQTTSQYSNTRNTNRVYSQSNYTNKTSQSSKTSATTATTTTNSQSSYTGTTGSAKAWIAQHESGNSYSATNGQYIGKYQLSSSYLKGDYSPANQERVADNYVTSRYGSWEGAKAFWQSHGWY